MNITFKIQLYILFILGPLAVLTNIEQSRIKELQHKDRLFLCATLEIIRLISSAMKPPSLSTFSSLIFS